MKRAWLLTSSLAVALAGSVSSASAQIKASMAPIEPIPDPRVGLKAGLFDAGTALWNLQLLTNDASLGVHNPSFYNDVIVNTLAQDLTK